MVTVAPAGAAIKFTRPSTAVSSPAEISIPPATNEIAFPSGTASAPPSNRITGPGPVLFKNPNAAGAAEVKTPARAGFAVNRPPSFNPTESALYDTNDP